MSTIHCPHLNHYVVVFYICVSLNCQIATYGFSLTNIPMGNYLATGHLGYSKSYWPLQSWNYMPDRTPDLICACYSYLFPINIHSRLQNPYLIFQAPAQSHKVRRKIG